MNANPFENAEGVPRLVFGTTLYCGSPRIAELACRAGFEVVWIEMEHGPTNFTTAESICYATLAHGGLPLIRLPDASRANVLRAVEVGARILLVPMVNHADTAAELVQHAKFTPVGSRGMNTNTPGTEFGLHGLPSVLRDTNERLQLFAQIETRQAIENLDDICKVDGLSGVFIGPSDLSVDLGMPGDFDNPKLAEAILDIIHRARATGKRAGILLPPGKLLEASIEAGAQLLIVGSDVGNLRSIWSEIVQKCAAFESKPGRCAESHGEQLFPR